jgi:RimJ/RimL family protein N-acetyltransferase
MILVFSKERSVDQYIASWVFKATDSQRDIMRDDYHTIGVVSRDGQFLAGIVYHDYKPIGSNGQIEVSLAASSPRWAHRSIIAGLLYYPFGQLNCHLVLASIRKGNARSRKLVKGLGFGEIGAIPHRPYADDIVVYALRREVAIRMWLPNLADKKVAA